MRRLILILLAISILFITSCKDETKLISDFNTDFPNAEELSFELFKTYENPILDIDYIEDSLIWAIPFLVSENIGFCYDLNTGEKLSSIATTGKADHEIKSYDGLNIVGDSIQIIDYRKSLKSFSKRDIINNVPMNERGFSVTNIPDSINLNGNYVKLPNGDMFGVLNSIAYGDMVHLNHLINNNTIVMYNETEARGYDVIDYESFGAKKNPVPEMKKFNFDFNDKVQFAYSLGVYDIKNSETAVLSLGNQFILYTFDIESGKVANEKRYTKLESDNEESSTGTTNALKLNIKSIKASDEYIYCTVGGYFSEEEMKLNKRESAIFVFDWDLNPVKRINLPKIDGVRRFTISEDCKAIYYMLDNETSSTLYKADLAI